MYVTIHPCAYVCIGFAFICLFVLLNAAFYGHTHMHSRAVQNRPQLQLLHDLDRVVVPGMRYGQNAQQGDYVAVRFMKSSLKATLSLRIRSLTMAHMS